MLVTLTCDHAILRQIEVVDIQVVQKNTGIRVTVYGADGIGYAGEVPDCTMWDFFENANEDRRIEIGVNPICLQKRGVFIQPKGLV